MAFFALAAGHGSTDPGAVLGSRKEKDDNLRLSLAVEVELKKRGHKTVQYRTNDSVSCSASACKSWLAKQKADFAIVFHRNAFNKSATGVEVWSYKADENIAAALSAAIASASGLYNRGKKPNGAAWLNSSVRCCEPEVGFIDNANDNTKFDTNFNKIVKI
jgi:N-acetylmuramoyl-L-alanine amidase